MNLYAKKKITKRLSSLNIREFLLRYVILHFFAKNKYLLYLLLLQSRFYFNTYNVELNFRHFNIAFILLKNKY